MSTQLRHKGRFVKENIVAAKAKRVAALQAASRKRAQKARESLVPEQPGSSQERKRHGRNNPFFAYNIHDIVFYL